MVILMKYLLIGVLLFSPLFINAQPQDIRYQQLEIRISDDSYIENEIVTNGLNTINSKEFRIPITNPDPFLGVAFKLYGSNYTKSV